MLNLARLVVLSSRVYFFHNPMLTDLRPDVSSGVLLEAGAITGLTGGGTQQKQTTTTTATTITSSSKKQQQKSDIDFPMQGRKEWCRTSSGGGRRWCFYFNSVRITCVLMHSKQPPPPG